jgi:RNA recognition motif-containing protein
MAMTIFVSNFDHAMTEDALRRLFEPFGRVGRLKVRSLGRYTAFAIVEMPDSAEGNRAIEALNGSLLNTQPLIVAECGFDEGQHPFGD